MKNIELLSPCGSMESFIGAVNNGCNAVYLGGKNFSARKNANNFSNEEIEEVVKIGKKLDVKVYLTVNTLYFNNEINDLMNFLDEMYKYGVDAFIIQDIGLLEIIKERYPLIEIHGSTQLSCHSLEDVKYIEALGFHRIVVNREMSIKDIEHISKETNIDLEVFGHGALCYAFSGQCLMSSMIGGRSGNRGDCTQCCRMEYEVCDEKNIYKKGYLLSPKDMNSIDNVEKLNEIGVSLKLEGRMKNAKYVSYITREYRNKINKLYVDKKELAKAFNRGGSLNEGYFQEYSSVNMMSTETPKSSGTYVGKVYHYSPKNNKVTILLDEEVYCGDGVEIWSTKHVGTNINKDGFIGDKISVFIEGDIKKGDLVYKSYDKKFNDALKQDITKINRKSNINCNVYIKKEEPIKLILEKNEVKVEVVGSNVDKAINNPTTKENILSKLQQTGDTYFSMSFKNVEIEEDVYVSIKDLKELRRIGINKLYNAIDETIPRDIVPGKIKIPKKIVTTGAVNALDLINNKIDGKNVSVYLHNIDKFNELLESEIHRFYIPIHKILKNVFYYIKECKKYNKELYVALPAISETDDEEILKSQINSLNALEINGFLVSNYGQLNMVKRNIVLDYNFNITNSFSLEYLENFENIERVTLSPECKMNIYDEKTEVICQGKISVMETRQCPVGLYIGNKGPEKFCALKNKENKYFLRDRKNAKYNIETNCNICKASILDCKDINLKVTKEMKNIRVYMD
ncbi:MAG: DUF3656 domain-containing protein [Lachnospirales bacterium]